jgi:hypothetical protein
MMGAAGAAMRGGHFLPEPLADFEKAGAAVMPSGAHLAV